MAVQTIYPFRNPPAFRLNTRGAMLQVPRQTSVNHFETDNATLTVTLTDSRNQEIPATVTATMETAASDILILTPPEGLPFGRYTLATTVTHQGKTRTTSQRYDWRGDTSLDPTVAWQVHSPNGRFLLTGNTSDFAASDTPTFSLRPVNRTEVAGFIPSFRAAGARAAVPTNVTATVTSVHHPDLPAAAAQTQTQADGTVIVTLAPTTAFTPGLYRVAVTAEGETATQDFSWGVLAVNVNKSVYSVGETAQVMFALLTSEGQGVCGDYLSADITAPDGNVTRLATSDSTITVTAGCGDHAVDAPPDYIASYVTTLPGRYTITVQAKPWNEEDPVPHIQNDHFDVTAEGLLDVSRDGPTRIDPFSHAYPMRITVTARDGWQGALTEVVPSSFVITETAPTATVVTAGKTQTIRWPMNLAAGVAQTVTYVFQAPKVSPQFYLLGPAEFGTLFRESRSWQLAADPISNFTCDWNGSSSNAWSTAGNWSNCNSTFPANTCAGSSGNCYYVSINNATSNPVLLGSTARTISGLNIGTSTTGTSLTIDQTAGTLTIANIGTQPSGFLKGGVQVGGASTTGVLNLNPPGAATCLTTNENGAVTITSANGTITSSQSNTCTWDQNNNQTRTSNGTLSGSWSLLLPGSLTNTGTINLSGGTVTVDTNTPTISCNNATRSNNKFNALTANVSTTLAGSCLFGGVVTIASTRTLTTGTGTHESSGTGTPIANSGTFTATAGNTWMFTGNGTVNVSALTYSNLDLKPAGSTSLILGTGASQTITVSSNLAVGDGTNTGGATAATNNAALAVTGNVTINANSTLTASNSAALTVTGNWTNNGTFAPGSGKVTLNGTATNATITAGTGGFNNLDINNGLVGYWKLDEGTGTSTTADASGNANTGTLTNIDSSDWQAGRTATYYGNDPGSLNFDGGATEYITMGAPASLNITGAISICFWVQPDDLSTFPTIVSNYDSTGANGQYEVYISNTGVVNFNIGNASSYEEYNTNTAPISVGSWYHICTAHNGGTTTTIYVNGSSVANTRTGSVSAPTSGYGNTVVARSGDSGGAYCDCRLDDVRIYTRVLTSTEVSDLAAGNHNAAATYTMQDNMTVSGNLTVRTGKIDAKSGGNYTLSVGGDYINVSNLDPRSGKVKLTATATGKKLQADMPFYDLEFNGSGGGWTADQQRVDANNNLTITAGTFDVSAAAYNGGVSCPVTVGGSWSNAATFTARTGTVTLDAGATGKTITGNGASGPFYNLTLNNASGGWTLQDATTVSRVFTITAGAFNNGSATLTLSGTTGAPFAALGGSGTFAGGTGTIAYSGNNAGGNTTVRDVAYNSLTVNNGSETFDLAANTTLTGTVTITAGTLDATTSNRTLTVGGSWSNAGTFTARSATVTFNTATTATVGGGATTFYNLTISHSAAKEVDFSTTAAHIIHITNTFTVAGNSGNRIKLYSTLGGTKWHIHPTGTAAVDYADVKDGGCESGSITMAPTNSISSGNNDACWGLASNQNPNTPTSLTQKKVTGGATLATGDWTNETQVQFTASGDDPDASDTLYLCVEKDILGTAFSNTEDSCGSGVAYSGSPVTVTVTITSLTDASEYHWQARLKDAASAYSAWAAYGANAESARDFGVDTTAPTTATVYDGTSAGVDAAQNGDGSLSQLSANWNAFSATVSGLSRYDYSIGTTAGGTDIKTWTSNSTTTSVTSTGLTLKTGQMYYVNVRAVDNAANTSATASSDGQYVTPTLTFGVSPSAVTFANLNAGNNNTNTQDITLTTSTNAANGYVVKAFRTALLTFGSVTIPDFADGSYAAPATWGSGQCTGTSCGFGYTSSDTTIGGVDLFAGATKFAPFATSGVGDTVADHTSAVSGTPVSNESFTITAKVAVSVTQPAGVYTTTIVYTIVPKY